jgi:hypothetical protein
MPQLIETAPSGPMIKDELTRLKRMMAKISESAFWGDIKTTPSGLIIPCQEISESHAASGCWVKYCKRYWHTQMKDYGTTICPEADGYMDDHKLAWKE